MWRFYTDSGLPAFPRLWFPLQVALGQREFLRVWGGDYPTPDGTAIRDYIHVMDLAEGHVAAVANVLKNAEFGCQAINLGTGTGEAVPRVAY